MKIKSLYTHLNNIGIVDGLSKLEEKRVRLLNIFIANWFVIELVLMIEDIINKEDPTIQLLVHSGNVIGLLATLFLQYKYRYKVARVLFFILILYSNFMFCNFAEKGGYIEYFYIVIPAFLLLFTNNNYLLYGTFIISYLLFVIPINVFNIYPEGTFGSPILIMVEFVIIFFLVQYFKNTNIKNEAALESQREQLQQLNEFQSQFFINISHEIRTPLTLINGEIDKLNIFNNTSYINESKDIKKGLNKQVNKIKTIVDDVLDLAKMKEINFKVHTKQVLANDLIEKSYASFKPLCEQKEISLVINKTNNLCYIDVDLTYFERALNNIIVNAIKYTPKKGVITLVLKEQANTIVFAIKDTGMGIPKNETKLITNRFYQVNNHINKSGGSGVGLAFCKEIIGIHKGKLIIESQINKGSIFTIVIPKVLNPSVVVKKEVALIKEEIEDNYQEAITIQNKSNYKILIVDDNFEMRAYLKDILKAYTCLEAENGEVAMEMLLKQKINFVLTDYMMPVMDGLTLIQNIKSKNLTVPILMLTARSDFQSKLAVLRLGIDDYLNKPFEKEELLVRLENNLRNSIVREKFIDSSIDVKQELTDTNQWLANIKDYVYNNCGNNGFKLDDIITHFSISRSSLNRKIKTATGLTPNQFITEIKLQKARQILEINPSILLKSLALDVGFSHTSYFSKLYTARFGITPVVV